MKTLLLIVVFHLILLHHARTQNCVSTDNLELIIGGDFETIDIGNINFNSEYSPNASLEGEGTFNIGESAQLFHPGFVGIANGNSGNFLVVNGSSVPNQNVWCYTVDNLRPNTTYFFSVFVTTVAGGSPAQLQFFTNGIPLGTPFFAPIETGIWQQFFATWKSEENTSAQICLVNQNTTVGGNDFGLDDFSFSASCDKIKSTGPSPTLGKDTVLCGEALNLQLSSGIDNIENVNFNWSNGSTDPLINIEQPGTYVLCVDSGGLACFKSDTIIVELKQPTPPEVNDIVVCQNQPIPDFNIIYDPQNTLLWYSDMDSPLPLNATPEINTNEVKETVFYISQIESKGNTICESERMPVSIEVLPTPVSELPMISEVCSNQELIIGTLHNDNFKYEWLPYVSNMSDTSSSALIRINNNQATFIDSLYILNISDKISGCKVTDSSIVRIYPNPQVSFSAPETLCVNSLPQPLIGFPEGGIFKGPFITNNIFEPQEIGDYSILYTYSNDNNCSDSTSQIITVSDYGKLLLDLGKDTVLCIGESLELSANTGVNFQWYPGNDQSRSIVVSPLETTKFYLTAIDSAACLSGKDSIEIAIKPYRKLDIDIGNDTSFCLGNNQKMTLSANSGRDFLWMPGGQLTSSIEVSPVETTKYIINAIDSIACLKATDSIQITILPYREIDLNIGNDTSLCLGQSIELKASEGRNFEWAPGGETTKNIEVAPETSTIYFVNVIDSVACTIGNDSINISIDLPLEEILEYDTMSFCFDDGTTFARGINAKTYNWNTGETDREIEISKAGQYILTAFNGSCHKIDTVIIFDKCRTALFVPSAFSPNLDGINDSFEIFGTHLYKFNIKIYNRWGELIFSSDDPGVFWDGNYAGDPVLPGNYPWVINYSIKEDFNLTKPMVVHGNVVLIR